MSATFESLGLDKSLVEIVQSIGWNEPTPIQEKTIPDALEGKNVCGAAETGSGKTGAFLLPLINKLINNGFQEKFALIMAPTHELVIQISEVATNMCKYLDREVKIAAIHGGDNVVEQMSILSKKPHIIVATPGKISYLLREAIGFDLNSVCYIVFDEADKMSNTEFFDDIQIIVSSTNSKRQILLFSATMPENLYRFVNNFTKEASISSLTKANQVPSKLTEYMCTVRDTPLQKYQTLYYIINERPDDQFIIFIDRCRHAIILSLLLHNLGVSVGTLTGNMDSTARKKALKDLQMKNIRVLVSTYVSVRGIDVPTIDCVIIVDIPTEFSEYVHRVGRAGRAGRAGKSIIFVTKESKSRFQQLGAFLKRKLELYKLDYKAIKELEKTIEDAETIALTKYKKMSRGERV